MHLIPSETELPKVAAVPGVMVVPPEIVYGRHVSVAAPRKSLQTVLTIEPDAKIDGGGAARVDAKFVGVPIVGVVPDTEMATILGPVVDINANTHEVPTAIN